MAKTQKIEEDKVPLSEEQFDKIMKEGAEKDASDSKTQLALKGLEFFVNFETRTIYLEDEIDIFTPAFIKRRVESICQITKDTESPVNIEICTYGGDAYAMLALVDLIRTCPVKINTIARGPVMSAGAFVLAAGTGVRFAYPNSQIMLHDIFGMVKGSSRDVIVESDHWKKLQDRCYTILSEFTGKPKSFWKRKFKTTLYLSAKEALKYNLIDEVVNKWKI